MRASIVRTTAIAFLAAVACRSTVDWTGHEHVTHGMSSSANKPPDAELTLSRPPKTVYDCIAAELRRQRLPGGIRRQSDRWLTTGWFTWPGSEKRGFWIWQKMWERRAQINYEIVPRIESGTSLLIYAGLQERPNIYYDWIEASEYHPDVLGEVAQQAADSAGRLCGDH